MFSFKKSTLGFVSLSLLISLLFLVKMIAASGMFLLGAWAQSRGEKQVALRSTIAFVITRHDPTLDPAVDAQRALLGAEIYLIDGDGTNPRRLTENNYFDCFPALSPDGSRVVFDSNRLRTAEEPFNTSDLFVMNADGTAQTSLTRGSCATCPTPTRGTQCFGRLVTSPT